MSNTSSALLPYILQTLSQKSELCETYENVCDEIKEILTKENRIGKNENIENIIEDALEVGQNLGILVLTDDLVRMPFKYNYDATTAEKPTASKKRTTKMPTLSQLNFLFTQPRRTHSVRPSRIAYDPERRHRVRRRSRARKGRSVRRSSGKRSRRRSHRRPLSRH